MNVYANWRFSPQRAAALGWECVYRGLGKFTKWEHRAGWRLEHCGHPTALWPWALYDPRGEMILQPSGRAWNTLPDAMQYVKEQELRNAN